MRLSQPIQRPDQRAEPEIFGPAKDAALRLRKSESEDRGRVGVVGAADDALLQAAEGLARLGGKEFSRIASGSGCSVEAETREFRPRQGFRLPSLGQSKKPPPARRPDRPAATNAASVGSASARQKRRSRPSARACLACDRFSATPVSSSMASGPSARPLATAAASMASTATPSATMATASSR